MAGEALTGPPPYEESRRSTGKCKKETSERSTTCPAEWRVVWSGEGLPSDAMRRRADEKAGEVEDISRGRGGWGLADRVIESFCEGCTAGASPPSASGEGSLESGERFALRRNLPALRLAINSECKYERKCNMRRNVQKIWAVDALRTFVNTKSHWYD